MTFTARALVIRALLTLMLLVASLFLLAYRINPTYPVDDAYISFRYAANWAAGYGPVFNPGEKVEGYSNFLWTALLALFAEAGVTPPLGARLLAIANLGLLFWFLLSASVRWSIASKSAALTIGTTGCLILSLSPHTVRNVLSGLEAPMAAALLLMGVLSLAHERHWSSPFLFLLLALTRPEGVLIALGASCVALVLATRGEIVGGMSRRERALREAGRWVMVFLIPYTIWFGWRWWYYDSALPNALQAKSGLPHEQALQQGIDYVVGFITPYWPLAILGIVGTVVSLARHELAGTLAAIFLVMLAGGNLVMGAADPYVHFSRYIYSALPLLVLLAISGAQKLCGWEAERHSSRRTTVLLLVVSLVLIQIWIVAAAAWLPWERSTRAAQRFPPQRFISGFDRIVSQDRSPHLDPAWRTMLPHHHLAAWLLEHADPSDQLATSEVGVAPYYTDLPVLDLFGLTDAHIASLAGPPGSDADADYVFGEAPRFITSTVDSSCLCGGTPGEARLRTDWRLRSKYDVVNVFPYGHLRMLLFERRSEPLFFVHYDFVALFHYERVLVVGDDDREQWAPTLAQEHAGAGNIASHWTEAERHCLLRLLDDGGQLADGRFPPFVADAIRAWLRNWQPLLYHHPLEGDQRLAIRYTDVSIPPGAFLEFGLITSPEHWSPEHGDGVRYEIIIREDTGPAAVAFSEYIDAKNDLDDRGWQRRAIDLAHWSGRTVDVEFVTTPGPAGDAANDFGGWGGPKIVIASDSSAEQRTPCGAAASAIH